MLRRLLSVFTVAIALILPGLAVALILPGTQQTAISLAAIPSANASEVRAAAVAPASPAAAHDQSFASPLAQVHAGEPTTWLMALAFLALIILRRTRSNRAI